jgi:hypothetical protein
MMVYAIILGLEFFFFLSVQFLMKVIGVQYGFPLTYEDGEVPWSSNLHNKFGYSFHNNSITYVLLYL